MNDLTQYATVAGIAVNTIAAAWLAVTVWLEKKRRLEAEIKKQERDDAMAAAQKERDDAQAAKREQWEEDARAFNRRMEELGKVQVRQGNVAANMAKQAKEAVIKGQEKIVETIEASQSERRDQVSDLKVLTEKALDLNANALTAANNVNAKIESYGKKLTDIGRETIPDEPPH